MRRPRRSRRKWQVGYNLFMNFCKSKGVYKCCSEDILLEFFKDMVLKKKVSIIWNIYRQLSSALHAKTNLNIERYQKLRKFLRQMCRGGVLTEKKIDDFIWKAPDDIFLIVKVALIFIVSGSCRRNELAKIKVTDVQDLSSSLLIRLPGNKTSKSRSFEVKGAYLIKCKKYISLRPRNFKSNQFFFHIKNGEVLMQNVGCRYFAKVPRIVATFYNFPHLERYTEASFRFLFNSEGRRDIKYEEVDIPNIEQEVLHNISIVRHEVKVESVEDEQDTPRTSIKKGPGKERSIPVTSGAVLNENQFSSSRITAKRSQEIKLPQIRHTDTTEVSGSDCGASLCPDVRLGEAVGISFQTSQDNLSRTRDLGFIQSISEIARTGSEVSDATRICELPSSFQEPAATVKSVYVKSKWRTTAQKKAAKRRRQESELWASVGVWDLAPEPVSALPLLSSEASELKETSDFITPVMMSKDPCGAEMFDRTTRNESSSITANSENFFYNGFTANYVKRNNSHKICDTDNSAVSGIDFFSLSDPSVGLGETLVSSLQILQDNVSEAGYFISRNLGSGEPDSQRVSAWSETRDSTRGFEPPTHLNELTGSTESVKIKSKGRTTAQKKAARRRRQEAELQALAGVYVSAPGSTSNKTLEFLTGEGTKASCGATRNSSTGLKNHGRNLYDNEDTSNYTEENNIPQLRHIYASREPGTDPVTPPDPTFGSDKAVGTSLQETQNNIVDKCYLRLGNWGSGQLASQSVRTGSAPRDSTEPSLPFNDPTSAIDWVKVKSKGRTTTQKKAARRRRQEADLHALEVCDSAPGSTSVILSLSSEAPVCKKTWEFLTGDETKTSCTATRNSSAGLKNHSGNLYDNEDTSTYTEENNLPELRQIYASRVSGIHPVTPPDPDFNLGKAVGTSLQETQDNIVDKFYLSLGNWGSGQLGLQSVHTGSAPRNSTEASLPFNEPTSAIDSVNVKSKGRTTAQKKAARRRRQEADLHALDVCDSTPGSTSVILSLSSEVSVSKQTSEFSSGEGYKTACGTVVKSTTNSTAGLKNHSGNLCYHEDTASYIEENNLQTYVSRVSDADPITPPNPDIGLGKAVGRSVQTPQNNIIESGSLNLGNLGSQTVRPVWTPRNSTMGTEPSLSCNEPTGAIDSVNVKTKWRTTAQKKATRRRRQEAELQTLAGAQNLTDESICLPPKAAVPRDTSELLTDERNKTSCESGPIVPTTRNFSICLKNRSDCLYYNGDTVSYDEENIPLQIRNTDASEVSGANCITPDPDDGLDEVFGISSQVPQSNRRRGSELRNSNALAYPTELVKAKSKGRTSAEKAARRKCLEVESQTIAAVRDSAPQTSSTSSTVLVLKDMSDGVKNEGDMLAQNSRNSSDSRAQIPNLSGFQDVLTKSFPLVADKVFPQVIVGVYGRVTDLDRAYREAFISALNLLIIDSLQSGAPTPRIRHVRIFRGHLLIEVADEESREWIRRELKNIRPFGLSELVEVDRNRLYLRRGVMRIPHCGDPVSNELIFKFLERQNGISCSQWRVWARTEGQGHVSLVVGVDAESSATIEARGCLLFCLSFQIKIMLKHGPSRE